ncbi:LOW QUALITY PROTEIN: hypothetical protein J0S82_008430, partial [Galemys pyrenaicus]
MKFFSELGMIFRSGIEELGLAEANLQHVCQKLSALPQRHCWACGEQREKQVLTTGSASSYETLLALFYIVCNILDSRPGLFFHEIIFVVKNSDFGNVKGELDGKLNYFSKLEQYDSGMDIWGEKLQISLQNWLSFFGNMFLEKHKCRYLDVAPIPSNPFSYIDVQNTPEVFSMDRSNTSRSAMSVGPGLPKYKFIMKSMNISSPLLEYVRNMIIRSATTYEILWVKIKQ